MGIRAAALNFAYAAYQSLPVMRPLADQSRFAGGTGPLDAPIMLVGEALGHHEEVAGRPFVGPAGQLLSRALNQAGIPRMACYITNVVKYRPPRNRTPYQFEILASRSCLHQEIAIVQPLTVVALGTVAARCLSQDWRTGIFAPWVLPGGDFSAEVLYLRHPAYVLREGEAEMGKLVDGLKRIAGDRNA